MLRKIFQAFVYSIRARVDLIYGGVIEIFVLYSSLFVNHGFLRDMIMRKMEEIWEEVKKGSGMEKKGESPKIVC